MLLRWLKTPPRVFWIEAVFTLAGVVLFQHHDAGALHWIGLVFLVLPIGSIVDALIVGVAECAP